MIDEKEYDERDHIGGRKSKEIDSEESKTYERDKIENPQSLKRIDNQKSRENVDFVDTDIELETYTIVEDTTSI